MPKLGKTLESVDLMLRLAAANQVAHRCLNFSSK